jgi:hypothetical protein
MATDLTPIVVTGALTITAGVIPLIFQAVTARADHVFTLTRDWQQRWFEFQRAKFERNHTASLQLLQLVNTLRKQRIDLERFEAERLAVDERLELVRSTQQHAESSEIRDAGRAEATVLKRRKADLEARLTRQVAANDELVKLGHESLDILRLDTEATEILGPYETLIGYSMADPSSRETLEAFKTFNRQLAVYLKDLETKVLQNPPSQAHIVRGDSE